MTVQERIRHLEEAEKQAHINVLIKREELRLAEIRLADISGRLNELGMIRRNDDTPADNRGEAQGGEAAR